jgi:hypothetical protein
MIGQNTASELPLGEGNVATGYTAAPASGGLLPDGALTEGTEPKATIYLSCLGATPLAVGLLVPGGGLRTRRL